MPILTISYLDEKCDEETWRQVLLPKREGLDPTLIRAFRQKTVENCLLAIPTGTVMTPVLDEESGNYIHCRINGVDVHLRGVNAVAGEIVHCKVTILLKTWEPVGAAERTGDKMAHRNYSFQVEVEACENIEADATHRLRIANVSASDYSRTHDHIVGNSRFAHLSGDKKRDQDISVRPIRTEVSERKDMDAVHHDETPKISLGDLIRNASSHAA